MWGGPNIPVFIFPSDTKNRKLQEDFNGKTGLAFKDKLFLFISKDNSVEEIRALFTHEYNHVCRLSKFKKSEEIYVLLDTIILEGLAENAVSESLGEGLTATWTTYYSNEDLEEMWDNIIKPNMHTLRSDHKHQEILYGLRSYPKRLATVLGIT